MPATPSVPSTSRPTCWRCRWHPRQRSDSISGWKRTSSRRRCCTSTRLINLNGGRSWGSIRSRLSVRHLLTRHSIMGLTVTRTKMPVPQGATVKRARRGGRGLGWRRDPMTRTIPSWRGSWPSCSSIKGLSRSTSGPCGRRRERRNCTTSLVLVLWAYMPGDPWTSTDSTASSGTCCRKSHGTFLGPRVACASRGRRTRSLYSRECMRLFALGPRPRDGETTRIA
mmetsp:Transcript_15525/g.44152  ORF Transcript_15525/g.44152 Transcript_15525/m.44152 type:complete len:225 (-) Transcript_15525:992-1666(-)